MIKNSKHFLLFICILLLTSLEGTLLSSDVNIMSVMTYNICYSRRAVNEFEKYSWENRKDAVYKLIKDADVTVVLLQEIHTQNIEDVRSNLSEYIWHFESTNARGGICSNGIGIRKSFLPKVEQRKFSYNFNQFEKSAEKVFGVLVGEYCFINCHFPMEEKGRLAMADNFHSCLPTDPNYRLVIAGDFNSFPAFRGYEQIETIGKVTETTCISDMAISESSVTNLTLATSSFKPYAFDSVPEELLKMPGKLDHIFVKGFHFTRSPIVMVDDLTLMEGYDFAPSDHYPLKALLVFE